MNARTLATTIRQFAPSKKELMASGLSAEDARAFRAMYELPKRKKRLQLGDSTTFHDFLSQFDADTLELPGLAFLKPQFQGDEVAFAKREADLLLLGDGGVFLINHANGERERIASSGDGFCRALTRAIQANTRPTIWRGNFSGLLHLLLEDAGIPKRRSSFWPGAISSTIAGFA